MKAEEIICYVEYIHKGISLFKVNDCDYYSFITIDKSALIRMIEDEHNETDMDLIVMIQYHSEKFTDEQLNRVLARVKDIIKHNDTYKDYRNVKEIQLI